MSDEPKAFPGPGAKNTHHTGMDLRDYFAATAMPVFISKDPYNEYDFGMIARLSYKMADAMIAQRSA